MRLVASVESSEVESSAVLLATSQSFSEVESSAASPSSVSSESLKAVVEEILALAPFEPELLAVFVQEFFGTEFSLSELESAPSWSAAGSLTVCALLKLVVLWESLLKNSNWLVVPAVAEFFRGRNYMPCRNWMSLRPEWPRQTLPVPSAQGQLSPS